MRALFSLTLIFLFLTFLVYANAKRAAVVGRQAMALFAAHDAEQASDLYEMLLKEPLPQWQKDTILYNLGTIRLSQGRSQEASELFKSISLSSLSSPLLLRYVRTNETFNDLIQALSEADIEQKHYFLQRASNHLNEAKQVDCLLNKLEDEHLTECKTAYDLHNLLQLTRVALTENRIQRSELILKGENVFVLIEILITGLKQLIKKIDRLQNVQDQSLQSSYFLFLAQSGQDINSIWKALDEKAIESDIKTRIQYAEDLYFEALEALQQGKQSNQLLSQSLSILRQIGDKIREQPQAQLERLLLHYQLLFLNDVLSLRDVQSLLIELKQIDLPSLQDVQKNLELSSTLLQSRQEKAARFFLLTSFNLLKEQVFKEDQENQSPTDIIKRAISKAQMALQLNRLYQPEQNILQQEQNILQTVQEKVLSYAQQFPTAVLALETERFRQFGSEEPYHRCQQHPWEQAIPLFEQGYQQAVRVQNFFAQRPTFSLAALPAQESIISFWQKTLQTMMQLQDVSAAQQSLQEPEQTPTDIHEVFNFLQQMELQDRPQGQEEGAKEIQAW